MAMTRFRWLSGFVTAAALLVAAPLAGVSTPLSAQQSPGIDEAGDSVSVHFADTDLRTIVEAMGRYLTKPVVTGDLPQVRASLNTPRPIARSAIPVLLSGLLGARRLKLVEDSAFYRIVPQQDSTSQPAAKDAAHSGSEPISLFVIRLKHAKAADVAATVNQLFGGSGEFAGSAAAPTNTLSDELHRNAAATLGAPPASGPPGGDRGGQAATLHGPVVIVPDALTNSLLIRSTHPDFDVIQSAVDQLDIRPLQVLIEVLIVEARHDNTFSLGTSLSLPPTSIGGDQTAEGELTGGGLGDLVIKLMHLGKSNIDAVLNAAEQRGDVKILSRPVLLASNNTEARFLVGSQRPFVQVSRSLPTDTPSRDQVVQYRDVGTKLTVRPTINQDGYVSLQLQQEINQATNETQFDAPVISTREAVTQVLVRDKQTIVIGGLRDLQQDHTSSGIPVLSSIPILGGLFGGTSQRTSSTELYLFLTPTIIRSDADVDSVTAPRLPEHPAE